MKFGDALEALEDGKRATRAIWAGNEAFISARDGIPYWQSNDHPEQVYHPDAGDLFAKDWEILS